MSHEVSRNDEEGNGEEDFLVTGKEQIPDDAVEISDTLGSFGGKEVKSVHSDRSHENDQGLAQENQCNDKK